jgi:deoxyribonuclease-1
MAKRTKRPHKARNTAVSLLILLIAIGVYLVTGTIPEEFHDYFPEEVRQILRPTPTPPPHTLPLPPGVGNTTIESFNKAKRLMMAIHAEAGQFITFYCSSTFDEKKRLDHSESGYSPKKGWNRAHYLEWEHVVPAHAFGQSFVEWRDGHEDCIDSKGKPFKGRNCAGKVNTLFRLMESDMYNLRPAIGEVNGLRSNYSFTMIEGEPRDFGDCNMEIKRSKAEPPEHRFGDIARTYMYMESAYPGHGIIFAKNQKLFAAWDTMDPVDEWECERNRKIEVIQQNVNLVVKKACEEVGL